jgi:hypothetical protein
MSPGASKHKLHHENETRMLSLEVDDSSQQTRRVFTKIAEVHQGHETAIPEATYGGWIEFQRLLRWYCRNAIRDIYIP